MKIVIYDLLHFEQIAPLIKICIFLGYDVEFFTGQSLKSSIESYPELSGSKIVFNFKQDDEHETSFIKKCISRCKNMPADLLLMNTVNSQYHFWYWHLRKVHSKKVFTVHEVNNFFCTPPKMNLRSLVRHWGKKKLQSLMSGYVVNTESMITYIAKKGLTNKPVFWIPAAVYDDRMIGSSDDSKLTIIVPGWIDQRRRDYKLIFDVYNKLLPGERDSIELIFAGMPYGQYGHDIVAAFRRLDPEGKRVKLFDYELTNPEFDKEMMKSDIVWSPSLLKTSLFDGSAESYGETKNSANTHLAVSHAKPMMIPGKLITTREIESSVARYENEQACVKLIGRLLHDRAYLKRLQENAITNAGKFPVEIVAGLFQKMITSVS